MFVIEVNWQISAAARKTSPSAISLNRRSSRPLAFGTGERIVFLPYTREVFAATQHWTEAHKIFPQQQPGSPVGYDQAALV